MTFRISICALILFALPCSAAVVINSTAYTGIVDNNTNGFAQQVTLNWNDSNSGGASLLVGEDILYRPTGTVSFIYIGSTAAHTANPGSNAVSFMITSSVTQGQYDFQIKLFDVSGASPVLIFVQDSTSDPHLKAQNFETSAQDNTPVPVISSTLAATGTTYSPFTYQVAATNSPLFFGATITGASGLPFGLSINPVTGVISGTPTVFGQFSITLSAQNSGQTGTAILNLDIHYPAHGGVGLPFYFYFFPVDAAAVSGTITATTLPAGLSIAPLDPTYAQGLVGKPLASAIFGLPTTAGKTTVTITGTFNSSTQLATIDITIDPALPPSPLITGITISRDPVRTSTDTTFTAVSQTLQAGAQVVFIFFKDNVVLPNGVQAPTTFGSGAVTRQFTDPGNYTAFAAVFDGVNIGTYSQNFMVEALQPSSAATTVVSGTITNPDNGIGISIPAGVGGVLDIDIVGIASAGVDGRDDNVSNSISGRSSVVGLDVGASRKNLAAKFTGKGIYVITTTVNGKKARRMVPIGGPETGIPLSVAAPRDDGSGIISGRSTITGKFFMNGAKKDQVKLSGTLTLPTGLDLTSPQSLDVGIGNVVETVTVLKGKGTSANGRLKLQLKTPKKGTHSAGFTLTLISPQLDAAGFDTEGISPQPKPTLSIQLGFVIGGVPYFSTVSVNARATGNTKSRSVQITGK